MPTLKRLRRSIEAGKLVEQKKSNPAEGYECIRKFNGKYEYMYANTERETFDTFEALYERAEPDAKEFTQDELNTWQIAPEATEEEKARLQPMFELVKADFVRHMEATLFRSRIKNPEVRKNIMAEIARVRNAKEE